MPTAPTNRAAAIRQLARISARWARGAAVVEIEGLWMEVLNDAVTTEEDDVDIRET